MKKIYITFDTIYGPIYIARYVADDFRCVSKLEDATNFKSIQEARDFYNRNKNLIQGKFMKSQMFRNPRVVVTDKKIYPLNYVL